MTRVSMLMTCVVIAASAAFAQQAATESAAIKRQYNTIKTNLTKAAERMPDDQYSFKATPDVRTFGAIIAHVTDAQGRVCSAMAGSQWQSAASKTAKADLVAALQASFDACDKVIDSLSDEDATKTVSMGRGGAVPKFAALWGMIVHSNEIYGSVSVYLRLKGLVPPSTQP